VNAVKVTVTHYEKMIIGLGYLADRIDDLSDLISDMDTVT
jgi:hypothetical protein